jgi:ankyrin repeat protein
MRNVILIFRKIIKINYGRLWDAAELGNFEVIQELIASNNKPYPLDLNAKTLDDWTALHLAANEGHTQIVDILLKNDINKEAVTKMGRKALHIATIKGNYDVVRLLIEAGCDLDYQDDDQSTPLHYASEHGYEKILRDLLDHHAKTNLKNYQGMTPVDLSQDVKIMQLFEEFGIDNEDSGYGRTLYGTSIRNNSRADHVSNLLFWGNMIKIK